MDPVINMIFRAMAVRLKEVNDKINNISDRIISDLACRIFFDGLLHPVPSSTVLKYTVGSNAVEIDNAIEAYWTNTALRQSATHYFAPLETTILHPVEAVLALAKNADGVHLLWTNPQWKGRNQIMTGLEDSNIGQMDDEKDCLYLALKCDGPGRECEAPNLLISGSGELRDRLRWARWRCTEQAGILGESGIPGDDYIEQLRQRRSHPEITLWGYGYFPHEHKEQYDEMFFDLLPGEAGDAPRELRQALSGQKEDFWSQMEPLYWIQIEFDRHIPTGILKSFEYAATNCAIAINSHFQKQSFYYHGPGTMAIELQAPARNLYDILCLDDNHGREYENVYAGKKENDCHYIPRVEGEALKIIVSPPQRGPMPDRFIISYRTSAGEAANGIGEGLINSLYNPFPGIESVINLTESRGGVDARSFDEMVASFPQVLRSRNRAIVVSDFQALSKAFDSRIKSATARQGSAVRNGLLTRCVEVEVDLGNYRFSLEEEADLFAARLERHLETRSPMGTVVVVKIK
jgi:hypothetical protein